MLSTVLVVLLFSTEGAGGSATIGIGKGEPKVLSHLPYGDFILYPVTALWELECNCGTSCGSAYRTITIGTLDETGRIGHDYYSGLALVGTTSSTGAAAKDFEPGRVLQAQIEGSGCLSAPVKSGALVLPPHLVGVIWYFTEDAKQVNCLQPGTAIMPLISSQAALNPGETLALHFSGAGIDHVETFDKTSIKDANRKYYVTATTTGTVDVWAVHSHAGESNHLTLQSAADACAGADGGSGGAPDPGDEPPPEKERSGCSAANGMTA
ncbi:MAG: hypothetical protein ACYC8T_28230, partial [Myxococcaceae bacterium]